MTNKQMTIAAYYAISADYMNSIIESGDRIDLHHVDPDLKYNDPIRYSQFLSADVVPMPLKEHLKLHKKGLKHKRMHNKKIGESVVATNKSKRLSDCIIKMTMKSGKTRYAMNGSEAAKLLGCSRQLVYQVLSHNPCFESYKTAKGCKLELISLKQYAAILKKGTK